MLYEVRIKQTHKGNELFRGTLADLSRTDVLCHGIHKIQDKLSEQRAQNLMQIAVMRALIAYYLMQVLPEVCCLLFVEMYDGAAEFCYRLIGYVNNVAQAENLKCSLLVDYQTE